MALDELTREQKEAICAHRADNHTIKDTLAWLAEEYPDAPEYKYTTVRLWFQKLEGRRLYNQALEAIRKDAKNREYANKESRILALIEIVGKIHNALRDMDPKVDGKFPQLFREFREGLSALRNETDGGFGSAELESAFNVMMKGIQESPFKWALKQNSPQTREIQSS